MIPLCTPKREKLIRGYPLYTRRYRGGPLVRGKEYKAESVGMFMPTTFLENHQVTDHIVKLVQNAKEELIIITPYLNLNARMRGALNEAKGNGAKITVYFRLEELAKKKNDADIKFLTEDVGAEMVYIERLHSKLYLNENSAVMSSMNMVAGSQNDSQEIGIWTDKDRLIRDFKHYSIDMYKRQTNVDYVPEVKSPRTRKSKPFTAINFLLVISLSIFILIINNSKVRTYSKGFQHLRYHCRMLD